MKIVAQRWMLVAPQKRGKPIIYAGLMSFTRAYLIERAEKTFYGGTTWAKLRKNGWRAVKLTLRGQS